MSQANNEDMNIMIVDENANNVLFWEMAIAECFPKVKSTVCKTGYEGLDVAKKNKFNFFIASWELKPMSGLIFMQKLKEQPKNRNTPFLVVSQVLTEEDLFIAQEFGITNYLAKPFDKPKVIDKIKTMVAAEQNLDSTQRTLRKVDDWLNENKVTESISLITSILKDGPHAARAYTLNGEIWTRTDHFEKAEKSFQQALKYDPDHARAISSLGKLYMKMKKPEKAIECFESLHKKAPKNMERLVNLGTAYLDNGDDKKAEELFKQVKGLDDENKDADAGMGKVAFARGNFDLAAQFFRESGKGAELATHFNNLGIALVNQNKFNEAIQLYKNAIGVLPDRNKTHLLEFNIGLAFKKCEQHHEAAAAFARSLIANPSYEKAYAGIGQSAKEAKLKGQALNAALLNDAVKLRNEWVAKHPPAAAPAASPKKAG